MTIRSGIRGTARAAGWVLFSVYRLVRPSLCGVLLVNVTVLMKARQVRPPTRAADRTASEAPVDLGAASALWQVEFARMSGLTTKAAGAMAAQALVVGGLTAMSDPSGLVAVLTVIAIVYLACALVTAVWVQLPRQVWTLLVSDVESSNVGGAMLDVVESNIPIATRMANLVTASVCDTARALFVLLVALVLRLVA